MTKDCTSFRKYQKIVEIRTALVSMLYFCLLSFYVLISWIFNEVRAGVVSVGERSQWWKVDWGRGSGQKKILSDLHLVGYKRTEQLFKNKIILLVSFRNWGQGWRGASERALVSRWKLWYQSLLKVSLNFEFIDLQSKIFGYVVKWMLLDWCRLDLL